MNGISVTISIADLAECRLGTETAMILQKLRTSGIPVRGVLLFGGIQEGTLFETIDFNGNMIYDWVSEDYHARHILDVAARPRTLGIRDFLDVVLRWAGRRAPVANR
jgi:hypothetical protein